MNELLVLVGVTSLAAGIALGRLRMLWLLADVASAGAAALAVQAAQCSGPWAGVMCRGLERASVPVDGMIYIEVVVLATLGWALGHWHRNDAD